MRLGSVRVQTICFRCYSAIFDTRLTSCQLVERSIPLPRDKADAQGTPRETMKLYFELLSIPLVC